jgi:hypothetical protein
MGGMTPAEQVMALHRETGVPVNLCKAALLEANGSPEMAKTILRRSICIDPKSAPGFWEQFKASTESAAEKPDSSQD